MTKKSWIIFVAVCFIVLAGLVYFSNKNKLDVSGVDTNKILATSVSSGNIADHVFGKVDSKVMLVEYGDYQCPSCGAAYQPLKDVTTKYQGKIAFVFRNFPLTSLHPNALAAAAAAEAAGLQGKYWEMHDKLYEGQASWGQLNANDRTGLFVSYAKDLGLNTDTFKNDLSADNVAQKINFDIALGKKLGVNATPTLYLGGKKADNVYNTQGALDETMLSSAIDALLK